LPLSRSASLVSLALLSSLSPLLTPSLSSLSPFLSHLSSCCGFWALSSPVTLSDSLQMDVVSAFQSGSSFQERQLRRQPSTSSQQQHDVTNVSSPTHVAFSTTATDANTAASTVGCECVSLVHENLTSSSSTLSPNVDFIHSYLSLLFLKKYKKYKNNHIFHVAW
jgi:hypothetical protein